MGRRQTWCGVRSARLDARTGYLGTRVRCPRRTPPVLIHPGVPRVVPVAQGGTWHVPLHCRRYPVRRHRQQRAAAAVRHCGTGVFIKPPNHVRPGGGANEGGTITFNFNNQPVQTTVKAILGDVLHANYLIAPDVKGTVTFATSQPVTQAEVLPILQMRLRATMPPSACKRAAPARVRRLRAKHDHGRRHALACADGARSKSRRGRAVTYRHCRQPAHRKHADHRTMRHRVVTAQFDRDGVMRYP